MQCLKSGDIFQIDFMVELKNIFEFFLVIKDCSQMQMYQIQEKHLQTMNGIGTIIVFV